MNAAPDNVIPLPTAGDALVRIEPGEYTAVYVRHKAMRIFRTAKLRLDFQLLEHPLIVLQRWYRVSDFQNGRIRAGRNSDLVRELSEVLGERLRADRLPIASLKGVVVRAVVRDVVIDGRRRNLSEINRYSTIEEIGRVG